MNLLVLSHLAQDTAWTARIDRTLSLFGTRLEKLGRAVPMMASALSTLVAGMEQVVIVGPGGPDGSVDEGVEALRRAVAVHYRPFTITLALSTAFTNRSALRRSAVRMASVW